jgi:hypothetical protein
MGLVANVGGNVQLMGEIEEAVGVVAVDVVQAKQSRGTPFPFTLPKAVCRVKLSVGSMMAGRPTKSTWTVQKWKRWASRRHAPHPIGRCRTHEMLSSFPP